MKNVIKMCASSEMFQVSLTVSGVFAVFLPKRDGSKTQKNSVLFW